MTLPDFGQNIPIAYRLKLMAFRSIYTILWGIPLPCLFIACAKLPEKGKSDIVIDELLSVSIVIALDRKGGYDEGYCADRSSRCLQTIFAEGNILTGYI